MNVECLNVSFNTSTYVLQVRTYSSIGFLSSSSSGGAHVISFVSIVHVPALLRITQFEVDLLRAMRFFLLWSTRGNIGVVRWPSRPLQQAPVNSASSLPYYCTICTINYHSCILPVYYGVHVLCSIMNVQHQTTVWMLSSYSATGELNYRTTTCRKVV